MIVVLYIPGDKFLDFLAGEKVEAVGGGQLNNTTVQIHVQPDEVILEPKKQLLKVGGFWGQRRPQNQGG